MQKNARALHSFEKNTKERKMLRSSEKNVCPILLIYIKMLSETSGFCSILEDLYVFLLYCNRILAGVGFRIFLFMNTVPNVFLEEKILMMSLKLFCDFHFFREQISCDWPWIVLLTGGLIFY